MGSPELTDDPVQVYLREMCTIPALTEDEEAELSRHVLTPDEHSDCAGQRLIEGNLRMVVAIAETYRGGGVHVLDLIQKGNDALLLALRTFAEHSDRQFSVYAAACINEAISKSIPISGGLTNK